MDAVRKNVLPVSADLHLIAGLELPVSHVILLHPHKRRIRVGLAVTVPILPQYLLLLLLFIHCCRPMLPRIGQLLAHFTRYRLIFQGRIDLLDGGRYLPFIDLVEG
jgi:hypothetical protein